MDQYVPVDGLRLHYRESGSPPARAAVVLHGIMGHAREWDPLTAALEADFRVFAVDQRGHGESDWAGEYTAAIMADDVATLIEQLGLAPVNLVGHSLGAMVTLVAAAHHPDLVERLVLIDVGPDSLTSEWAEQELPSTLEALGDSSYPDSEQVVEEWLTGNPLAREDLMRHYVEHSLVPRDDGRLVWRFDARGLVRFVTEGVTPEQLWNAIDRIDAPSLLIRGQHSEVLSPETAAEMVRRLADGRLIEIADGGHDLGVEQPEAVAGAVLDFLRS